MPEEDLENILTMSDEDLLQWMDEMGLNAEGLYGNYGDEQGFDWGF